MQFLVAALLNDMATGDSEPHVVGETYDRNEKLVPSEE